jgi:alkyl hydroperoxide reductase subunit AhpC
MAADIVTVSTDTKFVHLAGSRTRRSSPRCGTPWPPTPRGICLALRGTFMINPEGVLMNAETNYYNLGRNIDEMLRKFKANLYMSKKTNEVCPSKWKDEGDKTLAPSAKLVGKVHEALQS